MRKVILALDQGTTSSRAVVFDRKGKVLALAQKELHLMYPLPGWVEQNPEEIWATQMGVAGEAIQRAGLTPEDITGIGITNQRETTILWDRQTGKPVANAIGWQCRRSAGICDKLKREGWNQLVREKTGLLIDAYFSATKIAWLLQQDANLRKRASAGEICFGTVDSWLVWNLTKGKRHLTDTTNASRTMLFNIHQLEWDQELLQKLEIPPVMLPEVVPSTGIIAEADASFFGGSSIPVAGIAGDQQAALFGQACFDPGLAKNTYGTGCFILMNTGQTPMVSEKGLLTTVAWSDHQKTYYALEGSIFNAGAVIQWLRDEMKMIRDASESEAVAQSVPDTNGVFLVPAFTGMGAPYWDMYARGIIIGLTRDTSSAHVIRAGLEAIAFQTREVLELMEEEAGIQLKSLRTDGGAAANDFLMQFQADLLNREVTRAAVQETTALGAAYLAGMATGFWNGLEEVKSLWQPDRAFMPAMGEKTRNKLVGSWNKAVARSLNWADTENE
ncbi:MAG: glycerol kinase GlpK [Bacillota bacterium]|nr:glycerol kinase GlpK [Bacillota bacterium]MDW7678372.1 glycerol kinase GlpK [Bacillota bacterium]